MIKRFIIPLIEKELVLYIGAESWDKYVKHTKAKGRVGNLKEDETTPPPKGSGRAWGSWVYVDSLEDLNTVIHEVLHFLDDLYSYVNCDEESEFKSYLGADILEKVLVWREKELKKDGSK